jgi:hypothetical protein
MMAFLVCLALVLVDESTLPLFEALVGPVGKGWVLLVGFGRELRWVFCHMT